MSTRLASQYPLLAGVRSPADVKRFRGPAARALAGEIREFIIDSVTRTGGHLGAGLGVVELALALFAEFEFNHYDKLVWDVGHQCYPHKILSGRAGQFGTLRQWRGLSGFPDPRESPYDTVKSGHGGTSISTAIGFALAWRQNGEPQRKAVAVIGDGALQEGSAYEALNHGGRYDDLNVAVVLNDNGMSISPSVGALSDSLARFRPAFAASSPKQQERPRSGRARENGLDASPAVCPRPDGPPRRPAPSPLSVLFAQLGFLYVGPIDGHNVDALRAVFRSIRRRRRPVLIHVITSKGRGYRDGVPDRTCYHASAGATTAPDRLAKEYPEQGGASFTSVFARHAAEMAERDARVVVITAAMLEGTGLVDFKKRFPRRCFDVGMAEQHAVAVAAGLALAGFRPICAIYSTFLQRAYDQIFQEIALQRARVDVLHRPRRSGGLRRRDPQRRVRHRVPALSAQLHVDGAPRYGRAGSDDGPRHDL